MDEGRLVSAKTKRDLPEVDPKPNANLTLPEDRYGE